MPDQNDISSLSRRKLLGGAATIGGAALVGGTGTMAFFSDEETYANNQLVAGELDLKVDWEEHYSDWSEDESEAVSDVVMPMPGSTLTPSDIPEGYRGLPDPMNAVVAVPSDEVAAFMDATSVEAYPDANDDGIQEQDDAGNPVFPDAQSICDVDADLPEALTSDLRTEGSLGEPLINLTDVKPGDFGELTLSFHLCDNPGYVWMWGRNFTASENGVNEPESKDPDEEEGVVELLDEVETVAWYDESGDNTISGGTGEDICAHLVLDSSGSMTATDGDGVSRNEEMKTGAKQLAQIILGASGNNSVGVTEFDSNANLVQANTSTLSDVENAIDSVDADGGTAIDTGINTGDTELGNCPDGSRRIMIVVTDGQNNAGTGPVQTASDNAIADNTDEIFAVGTGGATQTTLQAIANPDDDAHIELTSDLTAAIANLSQVVLGEEVFFRGTLRELRDELTTANPTSDGAGSVPGFPLDGNRATNYDEVGGNTDDPNRDCFNASDTQHIGLAWYLPVNHANEIQSDSVSFDLGFYTEQCRHNDGTGQAMANDGPT